MEKAVFFILISCGILSQGICNVYQENNKNSSDLLIRHKRVTGGTMVPPNVARFLVHVLVNRNYHCPATLLTADVAISSAGCFINQNPQNMRIMSRSSAGVQFHEILRLIFLDPNFNLHDRSSNNLVLIRFAQPINFEASPNRPITIYNEYLPADHTQATVITWGRPYIERNRRIPAESLRTIHMLVISFEYCQHVYPNIIQTRNICAIASVPGEYCDNRDSGTPLIVNNKLLGIFVYRARNNNANPNVFMNLLEDGIRRWIHEHVPSLCLF